MRPPSGTSCCFRSSSARPSTPATLMQPAFRSFAEFYPHYLREHAHPACRRLHFVGTTLVLLCVVAAVWTGNAWILLGAPLAGYGFAWVGHFLFEHNRPATFRH